MRFIFPIGLISVVAGCAPADSGDFQYESTFEKPTRGLILHEDGESGHAGMFGTNCPFNAKSGTVTGDYDLPGTDEDVQDGERTMLGEITFTAVQPDAVHVVDKTGGEYLVQTYDIPGASQARLTEDTVVAVDVRCQALGIDLGTETPAWSADLGDCTGGDVEVDPVAGIGLSVSLTEAVLFGPAGTMPLGVRGDLVAWDGSSDTWYVATRGAPMLTALDADGTVRWTLDSGFPVMALEDAGLLSAAAVVLATPDGGGRIVFHSSEAGDVLYEGDTPSPAESLAVSNNGATLALVRPEQAFVFSLQER